MPWKNWDWKDKDYSLYFEGEANKPNLKLSKYLIFARVLF